MWFLKTHNFHCYYTFHMNLSHFNSESVLYFYRTLFVPRVVHMLQLCWHANKSYTWASSCKANTPSLVTRVIIACHADYSLWELAKYKNKGKVFGIEPRLHQNLGAIWELRQSICWNVTFLNLPSFYLFSVFVDIPTV